MKVVVNGSETSLADGTSVSGLLAEIGLSDKRVAVEHNGVILTTDRFGSAVLKEGDILEVLGFVGGG